MADVCSKVEPRIETLTEPELSLPGPTRFPLAENTLTAGTAFLLQQEFYHIGQMALLRKFVGLPAMRWS